MMKPWNPSQTIEHLFAQIEKGQEVATEAGEPYANAILARIGYTNIERTGLFHLPCRDWRNLPIADQTWANFKRNFKRADTDRRLTATSSSAGYTGAVSGITTKSETDTKVEKMAAQIEALTRALQSNNKRQKNKTKQTAETGKLSYC
jgi:hypothetical protein